VLGGFFSSIDWWRCATRTGGDQNKEGDLSPHAHVKALVPQVRGLGAEGIAQRLETCFQPIVEQKREALATTLMSSPSFYGVSTYFNLSIIFSTFNNHSVLIPYALYLQRRPKAKRFSFGGSVGFPQWISRQRQVFIIYSPTTNCLLSCSFLTIIRVSQNLPNTLFIRSSVQNDRYFTSM